MANKNYLVGFYHVEGFGPDSVETELFGSPREQYIRLDNEIRKRHPNKKTVRFGSRVESRDGESNWVEIFPGMTLRQIFLGADGKTENVSRKIGSVFFNSSPFEIGLLFSPASGRIQVQLLPKLRSEGVVRFSNSINPGQPASELLQIVREVLGNDARDIRLNLREKHIR